MELSAGRASRRNLLGATKVLPQNKRFPWHWFGAFFFSGSLILMMYYTTVTGWLLFYTGKFLVGQTPDSTAAAGGMFSTMLDSAQINVGYMLGAVLVGTFVCSIGLKKGVETVSKYLMGGMFLMLLLLCGYGFSLDGAAEGLTFYLKPDFSQLTLEAVPAALGQAFFTLSIGIGSILIFGSYASKENRLTNEAFFIILMDTMAALLCGFFIFPACMTCHVEANSGPGLIFVTLPAVFAQMPGGRWWGLLFFFFLVTAAMTTVIAVFENLIAMMMDEWKWSRRTASWINGAAVAVLSLPCALGFNVLKRIQPLGEGSTILDFEDYLLSDNLLVLGALFLCILCVTRYGWGWKNFIAETNTGKGIRFPLPEFYCRYILPLMILLLFCIGFWQRWLA